MAQEIMLFSEDWEETISSVPWKNNKPTQNTVSIQAMEHQRRRRRSSGDEEEDAMTVTFLWLRVYVVQASSSLTFFGRKHFAEGRRTGEESWMARRSWLVVVTTQHAGTILCTRTTTSSYYTRLTEWRGSFEEETKGKIVLPSESLLLCLHFESYRICSWWWNAAPRPQFYTRKQNSEYIEG